MSKYKNPIPQLAIDEKYVSQIYSVVFKFKGAVTREEAMTGISDFLDKSDGKIPNEWIKMGEPYSIRLKADVNRR